MYVIDLEGNEYPIQVTSTNENETNGNQSLSATILATKVNQAFISDIAEMWRIVDHDNVEHKIIYAKRKGIGAYKREYDYVQSDDTYFLSPAQPVKKTEKKLKQSTNLSVEIKAIPLFFDEFDNDRIYERYDKHMTALEAFQKIFQGTNFDFSLGDQFDAVQWEGFGAGESRLETFKRALERYKCEFRISGNMIFLERRIGRDTQFQYRHRLNASNIEQEIDANEMWTFARGYGDYGGEGETTEDDKEDWENAKLEREYTSPLAKIIGIRHAPPLKNGNITTKSKMDRELKALVDESLKISVSADIYDLQKQGYPIAQSTVGDRVFLIDPRIGLDDEVRVISQSKTRNWKGDVIDLNITFGSEKIAKRHQTNLTTAAKDIQDLIAGRKKLPYSVLPAAEQAALKALNEARTELIFGNAENGVQGIIAQDKDDPNRMMWINSAGWMISTDGGATSHVAATADGIVADVITAGTINADQVALIGGTGRNTLHITGDHIRQDGTFEWTWKGDTHKAEANVRLQKGHLRIRDEVRSQSIYLTPFGLSTFVDGEGDYQEQVGSSGTIEWWDRSYSPSKAKGITMSSWGGVAALRSDLSHVTLDSYQSVDIYSRNSVIHLSPKSDVYGGNNNFWMNIVDGSNDGFFMYGSRESGPGAGLRFSKSSDVNTVSVVDDNYNRGGNTVFDVGTLRTNNVYKRESNTTVYWNGTSGGSTSVSASDNTLRASGIRVNSGSSDMFLAVSDYVRVSNLAGYNEGKGITYKGIAARDFTKISNTLSFAGTFSSLTLKPDENEATKLINDIEIARMPGNKHPTFETLGKSAISSDVDENGTDMSKAVSLLLKSTQELSQEKEQIKSRINELEAKL